MTVRSPSLLALILAVALQAVVSDARADGVDTVLLSNGGRLRGNVMEEDPQHGTSIKLLDGTVRKLSPREVKQVIYGGQPAPTPPAPAAEPPVPQAPAPYAPYGAPPYPYGPPPTVYLAPQQPPPGVLPSIDARGGAVTPPPPNDAGNGLIITGIVLMSLGGATAAVAGALADSNTGDAIITLGVGAGVFGVGGIIALVGVGVHAANKPPPAVAVQPWITPRGAGLAVTF